MCKVTEAEVQEAGCEIWVSKSGKRTPINQMSDKHVRNALSDILRKWRNDVPQALAAEIVSNLEPGTLSEALGIPTPDDIPQVKRAADSEGGSPD